MNNKTREREKTYSYSFTAPVTVITSHTTIVKILRERNIQIRTEWEKRGSESIITASRGFPVPHYHWCCAGVVSCEGGIYQRIEIMKETTLMAGLLTVSPQSQ